jgi:hypothetical protein
MLTTILLVTNLIAVPVTIWNGIKMIRELRDKKQEVESLKNELHLERVASQVSMEKAMESARERYAGVSARNLRKRGMA